MKAHNVGAVLLAAGQSRRLGFPKQLVNVHGELLVRRVARVIARSSCDAELVVVGAQSEEVAVALSGLDVTITFNAEWATGMASSIRVGVDWARREGFGALVVAVVDQWKITTAHVDALVEAFSVSNKTNKTNKTKMVGSRYGGIVGVPAIFGAERFENLYALRGDQGARELLRNPGEATSIDWADGKDDVDTREQLLIASSSISIT